MAVLLPAVTPVDLAARRAASGVVVDHAWTAVPVVRIVAIMFRVCDAARLSSMPLPREIFQKILCLWSKLEAAPLSQFLSRSRRGHRRHVSPPALFLRHERRRHARRPHHVRAPRRRHPEDVRELPRAVHRREGDRPDGQAPLLQEQRLPPRHPELHVPGGRLHPRRRYRRRVHLRREVRGRELQAQAHRPGRPLHGARHFPIIIFPPLQGAEP